LFSVPFAPSRWICSSAWIFRPRWFLAKVSPRLSERKFPFHRNSLLKAFPHPILPLPSPPISTSMCCATTFPPSVPIVIFLYLPCWHHSFDPPILRLPPPISTKTFPLPAKSVALPWHDCSSTKVGFQMKVAPSESSNFPPHRPRQFPHLHPPTFLSNPIHPQFHPTQESTSDFVRLLKADWDNR
jgi:hypothetical protein